jgi:Kef-type K+ transport system membrane component KefB
MDDLFSFWTSSQESPVLVVGAVLFCGAVSGRVAEWFRLPPITGYIIAGLLLEPYGSGLISQTMLLGPLHVFTTISLAAIAFNIGSEFALSKLKAIGWTVVGLTLAQFLGSFMGVFAAMLLIGIPVPYALLLGAIATSTAPTTTYVMAKSLRARGKFIAYLYGVIALNDACCVILFGWCPLPSLRWSLPKATCRAYFPP